MVRVGVDIGSISVNIVILGADGSIQEDLYVRHKGRSIETARDLLTTIVGAYPVEFISATGTGARVFARLVGAAFVNEIVALSKSFSHLYPHVRSVIDIGGEDSKLIIFDSGESQRLTVRDFSMNALCAAGTGSFLDQQASRLRFSIEEFSEVALRSTNPPRIAGRCTVFAKSDMIHLQQIATPDYDIVAGLCYALARNFKGNIAKGKDVESPIAFVGGVAANAGMRRAMREVFNLNDGKFIVPEHYTAMGAIGAVWAVVDDPALRQEYRGLGDVESYLKAREEEACHAPLEISSHNLNVSYHIEPVHSTTRAYLGVDVGSISTNLVLVDEEKNVLAKRYLMTEGRPLEAVKKGLAEIGDEMGDKIEIIGVGTTGSGRYLTADFVGADIVRNEITAQAEAAINMDGAVDTIFEIGGQDSKYISISNGVIVDFEMNKACAAGTGSFLEEQAERLGISIKQEFSECALASEKPLKMGERCTVFIESDLVHHQQRGATTNDLVGGLSYSIAANYLNKVVGDRKIGERIFFQGGTAFNKGVIGAFEKILNRPVFVPSHHDVTGAIGVAILAMKERTWETSGFKGFDLSKRAYEIDTFECKGCENLCEIRRVTVEQESPLFYGSRCEKYDVVRRTEKKDIDDLFKVRDDLLYNVYNREGTGEPIGIPMVLYMHELFPFWKAFLTELGYQVVPSERTNKKVIRGGIETIIVETCFPVKLAHGHLLNLLTRGVKNIFLPSLINLKSAHGGQSSNTFACPYAQSLPYTVRGSVNFEMYGARLLSPVIHFGEGEETALANLAAFGKSVGISKKRIAAAYRVASEAQDRFYRLTKEAGRTFLENTGDDEKIMMIIGRPYNSTDSGANLNIQRKLIDLGVRPIPMDMVSGLGSDDNDDMTASMYWGYGQKILKAAEMIQKDPRLYGIYITNFGCGPDSFISHFFKKKMEGKPYLQLEIDEHSADAGMVTRLEAFLDSIKNARPEQKQRVVQRSHFEKEKGKRTVFLPHMSDHAITLAGAFKACGVDAEVMDESDEESVFWGRKFTTGKECFPCILTTGDMVKTVKKKGLDPDKIAFFMPSGEGPCRFGQYHRFHRLVLDDLGLSQIPIYAPNQDFRLYKELNIVGARFSRLGWKAIVATDLLIKLLHEVRPYEVVSGRTETVYTESLHAVKRSIENGADDLPSILSQSVKQFMAVGRSGEKRPVVGVVGEIYIRSNRFSNFDLVRRIEEFGGQVWLAPITEWILYVNYLSKKTARKKGGFSNLMNLFITDYIQKKEEHALEKLVTDYISYGPEPHIDTILEKAGPYIHESFKGEAILSVGKTVDFIEKHVSGIVNAMPFTCMPGTISSAIMKLLQNKYTVPVINVAYDGQGLTNILTRLEAFMYQVKERHKARS